MNTKTQMPPSGKNPYAPPRLINYGEVRLLTQGGSKGGNEDTAQSPAKMLSDRATKEGMVRIGEHPLGAGIYLFDYKPEYRDAYGHGRQFGVMADEVERVMPSAVYVHPDGYKMVDYAMLGISRTPH
jgi:hypothetical protein